MFTKDKRNYILLILKQNSNWLILSIIIFMIGFGLAFHFYNQESGFFSQLGAEQFQMLQDLGELIFGSSPLVGIPILFFNNLIALANMLVFGVILGITPLLGLFANGSMLGIVSASLLHEQTTVLPFLIVGILPHGIFELPAFFISAAFGLKLGFHIIFPLPHQKRGESFRYILSEIFTVIPLILLLLIIGAIVEVLITPYLIALFFSV